MHVLALACSCVSSCVRLRCLAIAKLLQYQIRPGSHILPHNLPMPIILTRRLLSSYSCEHCSVIFLNKGSSFSRIVIYILFMYVSRSYYSGYGYKDSRERCSKGAAEDSVVQMSWCWVVCEIGYVCVLLLRMGNVEWVLEGCICFVWWLC